MARWINGDNKVMCVDWPFKSFEIIVQSLVSKNYSVAAYNNVAFLIILFVGIVVLDNNHFST